MTNKTIVICSSSSFYEHVNAVAKELEDKGFNVIVPATANTMKASGNYDVKTLKTWYNDPKTFDIKTHKMREHFKEVAGGDAVLVVNDTKNGQQSYIGPNGLMEMGLAFYLDKPIYILNKVPKDLSIYEEVLGMGCAILNGNLSKIR